MSAIEDPGPSSELAGPAQTSDDLEDWLSDLRTEVSADPSGWIDKSASHEAPVRRDPQLSEDPAGQQPPDQAPERTKPSNGGRHRAPD